MDNGGEGSRSDAAPKLRIRLFGPLVIEVDLRSLGPRDLGGARPKQVFQILLAARGHRVPTDRLAELLWAHERPQNAAGSLQTFVSVLRRHLDTDRQRAKELVVTEAEAYRVPTELVDLDLDRFDELVDRSARESTGAARRSLEQALALARGDVLEDEPYAGWAQDLRRTYQARVLGAHLEAADAALAELDYAAALAHTEAATALDRFSERAHRTSMLALYALERQHDALDTYRRFRRRLDDELGLEPTAETRALESAILRQEDIRSLVPRAIVRQDGGADGAGVRFLGRTSELDVLERAARDALNGSVAVVFVEGEAGVGKTRLLDELATSLAGVRLGRSTSSELERHLPYVPLAAALRDALAGIELETLRHRPGLARILPELSVGETRPALTELDALEALADVIAEHAPLVLVLDDLQWADPATVAALSYLQRRGAGAVLVGAARSEELAPDHPVRRLQPTAAVRLEPLTPDELAPLGMPDLHESTGGNPRFIAEAVGNGGGGASSSLAETLLAQSRAEGPWAYRILTAASVLEQPFEPEPLAALLGVDAAELTEELERLCERRILRVDGFRFGFRYDLVRNVLLASLSPARRRLLRERLDQPGRGLRSVPPERSPDRVRGVVHHG
jgi:DNA-binding SARP family transcriptional activator